MKASLSRLLTATSILALLNSMAAADQRVLRRDQEEILNLTYYQESIRESYLNTSSVDPDSYLRKLANFLIDLKNELPRHHLGGSFEILPTRYAPEDDTYLSGLIYSMLIPVWCSLLLALIFLIFVIGRFLCKRCDAVMTERDEAFKPDNRIRYLLGTSIITLVTLAAAAGLIFGGLGYH